MIEKEEENVESNEKNSELDFATPEKQEARAYLRERFLRVITGIVGEKAKFNLYENSNVAGEFRGSDVNCSEVFVRNLQTPLGVVPEAILRVNDIVSMNVDIKSNGR
ncbi:hypothetical protein KPH14_009750 [Odynerus spinipes]|uniref:Gem-associated protein 7 n=1 Tax=Odynerus spinipes TaxID=1348599 RepID=A0AAD9VM56_9HYME|nr:hypothetical protein KPH14_009750 [Odynerus spinipes]